MTAGMPQNKRIERFLGDFFPVIMGPTASGKSALALDVARASGGEILSADSMQQYRGLDIGTAKASVEERRAVPHHLIDILDIKDKSDIFQYCERAEKTVREILARGARPVMEGGSGLYLHAFLYGLDRLPADPRLREELDRRYDNAEHFHELQEMMSVRAPADLEKFGAHRRKLIRACEVLLLSGQPMTALQSGTGRPRAGFRQFLLVWDRTVLRERIFRRTEIMLSSGWIEEAERMISAGLLESPTAWQALGYARIGEYLSGRISRAELRDKIAVATCQYARRQMTWFRNRHPDAELVDMPLS